jgi:hypothetical protein
MEKSYKEVEVVDRVQVPVYSFKASDLKDVKVDGYSAEFDFGGDIVKIEGTEAELLSCKTLIDEAVRTARRY